jgi:SAM-dependent methyltransferase
MKLTRNVDLNRFEYAVDAVHRILAGRAGLVYDIGAADGALGDSIRQKGNVYVAFDANPSAPAVRKWDIEKPLDDEGKQADVVLMLEVIEHLWNPRRCLEHVARTLRPGGHLILTTPNPRWSRARFDLLIRNELSCFTDQDLKLNHHVFTPWPHVVERLLSVCGFEVIEYVTLESHLAWPNRPATLSYPARVVKHLLSRAIEIGDPAGKGMAYAVAAVKSGARD